ncbi:MAG: hypothetical protein L3K06_02645 [Thermoplasmata archaeon]|nr:hypothetical protein [Thermoplasmata archaeon]MCI4354248.1 hypothetical protein [Thermoplasmata archaeon]
MERRDNDTAAGATMIRAAQSAFPAALFVALLVLGAVPIAPEPPTVPPTPGITLGGHGTAATTPSPVANFTAAISRMVSLLAVSGSGLLAIVWARVALSWFSNDVSKKIQAKDRARDALIGTAIFVAAISGLLWGVAHWVVTGT